MNAPRKTRRRFSLRIQVVTALLLCYLIPTLLLGLFARHVLSSVQRNVETALVSDSRHAWTMTEQNLDRVITLGQETVYDEELAEAWSRWRASAISDAEYLRTTRNYLERKFSRDRLFTFAAFVPADSGDLLVWNPSGQAAASAFFRDYLFPVLHAASPLDTGSVFTGEGDRLCLVRNVLNLRMQKTGILVLGLDRARLFQPLLDLQKSWGGEMKLQLDEYGDRNEEWSALPSGFSDIPGEGLLRYVRIEEADHYVLRLLLTLDRTVQYRDFYTFQRLTLFLLFLLIPVLLLLLFFVRRRLTRPIGLLADASRRIEAGELGVTVPMRGGDELGDLGVAFSSMSVRLQELIDRTFREELELKNAQIQALQSRINPHFLNNALETINWEARIEGSETIANMVSALSILLNASLGRNNRRLVSLKEELEVADGYIFFVQQRFEDALSVHREIAPDAVSCAVPLLTVQPVLENAVEHGIAPAGGGEIRLSAVREGDAMILRISNSGKSMDPDDRARIDAALSGDSGEGAHLGLANIASRLHLLYGSRAMISVSGGEGRETAVEIRVPQSGAEDGETSPASLQAMPEETFRKAVDS